ncbi:hypothetical protein PG993_004821 [Apiospora rasikravindrae]|uniref:Fungal N-terminal domain-containing protein n=1 Tax=Apiospora rasikravindrae TaxID=990691 RepID=A0ABR1TEH3_9PEZI
MADPLSVAGLAAGLVSLSLHLTSGITNYLDAVKCRAEELASARGHNESLRQTIVVLQSTLRKTQPLHPASTQIVVDALKPCETELKSLEDLVARLAGCGTGTNTWKSKLLDKSRKLRYALDRSKIQQLSSRLSQANTSLSVALQVLGVDVNQSSASPNRWMTRRNPISQLQADELSTAFTCICSTKHVSGFRSITRIGAFIWQNEQLPLVEQRAEQGIVSILGGLGVSPGSNQCLQPKWPVAPWLLLHADDERLPIWIGGHRISESYAFGPLSNAILSKNLVEISRLLNRFPGMLQERNVFGQTPLHLAVGKPECLSLLVKAAAGSSEILDSINDAGVTPLEVALTISKDTCRSRFQGRKCSRCGCAQGVCILLNAGCAVFPPRKWVMERTSNRALRRFARHMGYRRSRLKELSMAYLSIFENERFSIYSDRTPDHQANQLVEILEKHDISVPGILKLNAGKAHTASNSKSYNSVYAELQRPWQAELFWELGFRDLNSASPGRNVPPLSHMWKFASPQDLDYVYWLLEHGADPFILFSPERGTHQRKQLSWHRPAHVKDRSWAHLVFHEVGRICKCLLDGCTLQANQLKGITEFGFNHNGLTSLVFLSSRLSWYYERFWMTIPYNRHRDTMRYLTFTALGATHTCCCPWRPDSGLQWDPGEIDSLQEEERHLTEILEGLVTEFDRQFYAILDAQPDNHEQLAEFWGVCWLPRMQQVLAELDTTDLPEEAKRSTEEIGVVWYGPERLPDPGPIVNENSWDYWFGELDKIVSTK